MSENNYNDSNNNGYEKFCYMCHRPESSVGKLIKIPGDISICPECMQKIFDSMGPFMSQGMPFPGMPFPGNPVNGTNLQGAGSPSAGQNQNKPRENAPLEGTVEANGEDEQNQSEEQKTSDDQKSDGVSLGSIFGSGKFPNISMINLNDLQGMFGQQPKVKKKKKGEKTEPAINIRDIPAPHKIKESLDEYVIGQEQAKKVISVAVYNHYKRVATNTQDEIEIEKSNILMVGPTGCGKTYLIKTLARLLDVPLAIADATSLTEAGYIGDDIESVLSKLLTAADNDVEKAERGIVFIDEIDKIAKKKETNHRDVSGESVQQGMLKLLEGAEVEIPVGSTSKNAMVPMTTIDTRNILFICGGAFPGLDDIIKERLNERSSMGFYADLKDKYDGDENLLQKVTTEDIRNFGMIPEFIGRLPVLCALESLTEEMLVKILKEPKNAILKQYQKLLALDEVKLEFDEGALEFIAKKAKEKKVGARALRSIIEEFMLDIMYEIPKDDNIGRVVITKEYIEKTGGPQIYMRGTEALPMKETPVIAVQEA